MGRPGIRLFFVVVLYRRSYVRILHEQRHILHLSCKTFFAKFMLHFFDAFQKSLYPSQLSGRAFHMLFLNQAASFGLRSPAILWQLLQFDPSTLKNILYFFIFHSPYLVIHFIRYPSSQPDRIAKQKVRFEPF